MEEIKFYFPEHSYKRLMLMNEFGGFDGMVFSNTQQIDKLIESLKATKLKYLKEKQREYDEKHQLSLNF